MTYSTLQTVTNSQTFLSDEPLEGIGTDTAEWKRWQELQGREVTEDDFTDDLGLSGL